MATFTQTAGIHVLSLDRLVCLVLWHHIGDELSLGRRVLWIHRLNAAKAQ